MDHRLCSGWRLPLALIAAALLCGPRLAAAATLSIETMLADFRFDGLQVDYNPDVNDLFVRFDNPEVTFSVTDGSADPETYDSNHKLQSALFLDDDYGGVLRVAFNIFGSLPTVLGASAGDLLKNSALVMGGNNLQFIVDTDTVAGPLASRYRKANIFMTVAGLEVQDWLRLYNTTPGVSSNSNLLEIEENLAGEGLAPAVPVPPTLFLLLAAGIPLLLTRRRGPSRSA